MKLNIRKIVREEIQNVLNELGEEEASVTKIGGFKKGDYIRKVVNRGGGSRSVTNGFIYYIHPTGNWVKLTVYGGSDKSPKLIEPKGFKKITKGIPKKPSDL